jgi:hypothetical protein
MAANIDHRSFSFGSFATKTPCSTTAFEPDERFSDRTRPLIFR